MYPDGAGRRRPARDDSPPVADRRNRQRTNRGQTMLNTFAVYVENKPGVLTRVASLFRRRAFNIESLTVGHTEKPGVSRMTIVVDTDESGARRLEANLYKLVNVLRVENITARAVGRPRPRADQGRRHGDPRTQVMQLATCSARASSTSPRVADHRDHRHRGQDRRPARGARALRRPRDGAHRPRRDGARHQSQYTGNRDRQRQQSRRRRRRRARRLVLGVARAH